MMNTVEEIFAKDKLLKFWPSSTQTHQENIFATIRFILYASVLIYIITKDYRVVYLGLGIIAYINLVGVEVQESYVTEEPPTETFTDIPAPTDQVKMATGIPQETPDVPDFSKIHPKLDTTSLTQRFFKMPVNEIDSLKNLHGKLGRRDTVPYFNGGRNGR